MAEDITPSPPGNLPPSGRESSRAGESVDLSAEIPPAAHRQTIPTGAPFDPEPQRERIRGWIALSLLGMLAVVLLRRGRHQPQTGDHRFILLRLFAMAGMAIFLVPVRSTCRADISDAHSCW